MYAYPLLKTVEQDYDGYIYNKALLSYKNEAMDAAMTIAERIEEKRSLIWLRERVERTLKKLSQTETEMIAFRYFGKKRTAEADAGSERNYFRRQKRLSEKVGAMLEGAGVTKEVFERAFAKLDIFQSIYRFAERKGDAF